MKNCLTHRVSLFVLCLLPLAAIAQDKTTSEVVAVKPKAPVRALDLSLLFPLSPPENEVENIYHVVQTVVLDDLEKDAELVRAWISLPGEDKNQRLLDMQVETCPGDWKIVEDQQRRGRFLYTEIKNPGVSTLEFSVRFSVRRTPEFVELDPKATSNLTPTMKAMLAEYLVKDAPHMEVTEEFQRIADKVCGQETSISIQARKLLEHVAATVDHYSYSKDPNMPTCGIGDSKICKKQGGGCCTDLNSYFISLARAREIPSRLKMGYRLQSKNLEKVVDPGYRCWIEYFVPGAGWISADVVEADTPNGLGFKRWLTGLTSRRVYLNLGREFDFGSDIAVGKVNHMSIGYAEVDGKPVRLLPEGGLKPQLTRSIYFSETAL